MWSHVNLNKVGSRGQMSLMQKHFINGTTYIFSYPNIYPMVNKARSRWMEQKYHQRFSLLSNIYKSNTSNIYNPDVNLSLAYQTKCDNMFSYLKSDYILSYFQLRTNGVQPKTSPFSTCYIIWVNYQVVSQLSQLIFFHFCI